MTQPIIRKAQLHEVNDISQLGIDSKAHWGYSPDQMRVFEQELTISQETIQAYPTYVLEADGKLIGYYTLVPQDIEIVELKHLFIASSCLRQGFGCQLLHHACDTARTLGFQKIMLQSDPNAEQFYFAHGATRIEWITSSIPGRMLPYLEILLK